MTLWFKLENARNKTQQDMQWCVNIIHASEMLKLQL